MVGGAGDVESVFLKSPSGDKTLGEKHRGKGSRQ